MKHGPGSNRRGAVVIMVLACASVVVLLVLAALQVSLAQRRQLRREHQLEQTRWVLDAAIRKAQQTQQAIKTNSLELELTPKLLKFERAKVTAAFDRPTNTIQVQTIIESANQSSVTKRSARFNVLNLQD
jgi:type II secretory pathway component PulK